MNKPKAQGTAWETAFVQGARDMGLYADRLPEGGLRDAGDVWIGDHPDKDDKGWDIVLVAWSRLVQTSTTRRSADGARSVVVMSTDDFYKIAHLATAAGHAFIVECKATEKLNVTRVLGNAQKKLANWRKR